MDGVLKRKFRISLPEDECVIKLQEYCKFSSTLLKVPVVSKPLCADANCHNNVNHYVNTYGDLIDITPFDDGREYNMFSVMDVTDYYSGVVYDGKDYKILEPGLNVV